MFGNLQISWYHSYLRKYLLMLWKIKYFALGQKDKKMATKSGNIVPIANTPSVVYRTTNGHYVAVHISV